MSILLPGPGTRLVLPLSVPFSRKDSEDKEKREERAGGNAG